MSAKIETLFYRKFSNDFQTKKDPFGSEIIKMEALPPTPMLPPENAIELLDWNQLMVEIRDLCFSFSRNKKFMNNLNMSVPKSAMYVSILILICF